MASAQLPAPTLTAAERDDIVSRFGGDDAYLAAFTGWLSDRLEQFAAAAAREASNAAIREAIEQAAEALPVSMKPAPVEAVGESRDRA